MAENDQKGKVDSVAQQAMCQKSKNGNSSSANSVKSADSYSSEPRNIRIASLNGQKESRSNKPVSNKQ